MSGSRAPRRARLGPLRTSTDAMRHTVPAIDVMAPRAPVADDAPHGTRTGRACRHGARHGHGPDRKQPPAARRGRLGAPRGRLAARVRGAGLDGLRALPCAAGGCPTACGRPAWSRATGSSSCMANCPEVGVTYGAIWRAGGVVTPVLFLLSEAELRHVLTDGGAALAVTTPEFLPKVRGGRGGGRHAARRSSSPAGTPARSRRRAPAPAARCSTSPSWRPDPRATSSTRDPASTSPRCSTPAAPPAGPRASSLTHDALSASAWGAVTTTVDGRDSGAERGAAPAAAALARLRAHGHRRRHAHADRPAVGADALVRPGRVPRARRAAPGARRRRWSRR